ncbi:MAG: ankyrin repeat domain-containing protein [Desulfurellaceae bacterium]|nr:ankyrin repeat domain-containing protein [Desulfurellaceae bacterium]
MAQATPAAVQAMLDHGAYPNVQDEHGWTPLHVAVEKNPDPAVVALLLNHGAHPNARTQFGETPLRRDALARGGAAQRQLGGNQPAARPRRPNLTLCPLSGGMARYETPFPAACERSDSRPSRPDRHYAGRC